MHSSFPGGCYEYPLQGWDGSVSLASQRDVASRADVDGDVHGRVGTRLEELEFLREGWSEVEHLALVFLASAAVGSQDQLPNFHLVNL